MFEFTIGKTLNKITSQTDSFFTREGRKEMVGSIKDEMQKAIKKEIIKLGFSLNAPIHLTWSCYQNNDIPCMTCDSCALRKRGFDSAKIKDPILN